MLGAGVGTGGFFERARLLRVQPKRFELPTPYQLGSKKGERDVMFT
jgi:hypothetical protein